VFKTTAELETAVQNLFTELLPEEVTITKDILLQIADAVLSKNFQVQTENGMRQYFQTVRVVRVQREWVPITLHYQIDTSGVVDYIRIHAPTYIVERTKAENLS
jgi:hypothetical protein